MFRENAKFDGATALVWRPMTSLFGDTSKEVGVNASANGVGPTWPTKARNANLVCVFMLCQLFTCLTFGGGWELLIVFGCNAGSWLRRFLVVILIVMICTHWWWTWNKKGLPMLTAGGWIYFSPVTATGDFSRIRATATIFWIYFPSDSFFLLLFTHLLECVTPFVLRVSYGVFHWSVVFARRVRVLRKNWEYWWTAGGLQSNPFNLVEKLCQSARIESIRWINPTKYWVMNKFKNSFQSWTSTSVSQSFENSNHPPDKKWKRKPYRS